MAVLRKIINVKYNTVFAKQRLVRCFFTYSGKTNAVFCIIIRKDFL